MTSVKIVNVEYYMSYPVKDLDSCYSEYRGVEVRQVPVLQIFGSTREGTKTCLHIHGVLPYIYIPYDGAEPAERMAYKLAAEIDKALNISLGQASANSCFVHNIMLVSGIPLYGYHEKEHQYFKIFFYNPMIIKKACSLLENGVILGKHFQPHESHINYVLQFMIDYNLQGMNYINLSHVKYRIDPNNPELFANMPAVQILPVVVQKRSFCKLECDAIASDISNIDEISSGQLAVNPGLAALWEDERQRRRNKDLDSQLSFCLTQDRAMKPKSTATHRLFKQKLWEKLANPNYSDDTSIDPDKSVYPVETPSDVELLNASVVLTNALTTPSGDITISDSRIVENSPNNTSSMDQIDKNMLALLQDLKESTGGTNESLLETSAVENSAQQAQDLRLLQILQELKAAAAATVVEEDSILSQTVQDTTSDHSSSDEDEHNLSLPLAKTRENVENRESDDDLIWEDSFWDENCQIPQVDGTYDSSSCDEKDSVLSYGWQNIKIPTELCSQRANSSNTSITGTNDRTKELHNRYISLLPRNANEVYLAQNEEGTLGLNQLLTNGLNILKPSAPHNSDHKVKILSNIANPNFKISITVLAHDLTRFKINIHNKTNVEPSDLLSSNENSFHNKLTVENLANRDTEQFELLLSNGTYYTENVLSNVAYNDVNFGCDFASPHRETIARLDSIINSTPKRSFSLSFNENSKLSTIPDNKKKKSCFDSTVSLVHNLNASNCSEQSEICKEKKNNKVGESFPSSVVDSPQYFLLMEQNTNNVDQETVSEWPLFVDNNVLDTNWVISGQDTLTSIQELSENTFTFQKHVENQEDCHISVIDSEPCHTIEVSSDENRIVPWYAIGNQENCDKVVIEGVPCCDIEVGSEANSIGPWYTIENCDISVIDSVPCNEIEVNSADDSDGPWCTIKLQENCNESVIDSEFCSAIKVSSDENINGSLCRIENQGNCHKSVIDNEPCNTIVISSDENSSAERCSIVYSHDSSNKIKNEDLSTCSTNEIQESVVPELNVENKDRLNEDVSVTCTTDSDDSMCKIINENLLNYNTQHTLESNVSVVPALDSSCKACDSEKTTVHTPIVRKRGRPRKYPLKEVYTENNDALNEPEINTNETMNERVDLSLDMINVAESNESNYTNEYCTNRNKQQFEEVELVNRVVETPCKETASDKEENITFEMEIVEERSEDKSVETNTERSDQIEAVRKQIELTKEDKPTNKDDELRFEEKILKQDDKLGCEKVTVTKEELATVGKLIEKIIERYRKEETIKKEKELLKEDNISINMATLNTNQDSKPLKRLEKIDKLPCKIRNLKKRQLLNLPKVLRKLDKFPFRAKKLRKIRAVLAKIVQKRWRKTSVVKKLNQNRMLKSTANFTVTSSDNCSNFSEVKCKTNNDSEFKRNFPNCSSMILNSFQANNHSKMNTLSSKPRQDVRKNIPRHNNNAPMVNISKYRNLVTNMSSVTSYKKGDSKSSMNQHHAIRDVCNSLPLYQSANINNRALVSQSCRSTVRLDTRVNHLTQRTTQFNSNFVLSKGDFRGCFRTGIPDRDLFNTTSRAAKRNMSLNTNLYGFGEQNVVVDAGRKEIWIIPWGGSVVPMSRNYSTSFGSLDDGDHEIQSVAVVSSLDQPPGTSTDNVTLDQRDNTNGVSNPELQSEKSKKFKPSFDNNIESGEVKSKPKGSPGERRRSVRLLNKSEEIKTKHSSSEIVKEGISKEIKTKNDSPATAKAGKSEGVKTKNVKGVAKVSAYKLRRKPNCDAAGRNVNLISKTKINQDQTKSSGGTVQKQPRRQTSATQDIKGKKVLDSKLNRGIPSRSDNSVKPGAKRKTKTAALSSSVATKVASKATATSPGTSSEFTYKRKLRSSSGNGNKGKQSTQKTDKLTNTPSLTLDSSSSAETLLNVSPKEPKQHCNETTMKKDPAMVKKRANKTAIKKTAFEKNLIVDKVVKKTGMCAQKPKAKNTYWNLDGQGDTSDSSESSETESKEQQPVIRRRKLPVTRKTEPGSSAANIPLKKTKPTTDSTDRITRNKTKQLSTKPIEQKLLSKKPATISKLTKQLKVSLVPLNLQDEKSNDDSKKKQLSAAAQSNKILQDNKKPRNKGTLSTVAAKKVKETNCPVEKFDFEKFHVDSGRVSRNKLKHKIVKDKTGIKEQAQGSDLMKEKDKKTLQKVAKVSLIRENLLEKKKRLFSTSAKGKIIEPNKRSHTSGLDKTPTRKTGSKSFHTPPKFSPLNVKIKSPESKKAKINDNKNLVSELQTDPMKPVAISMKSPTKEQRSKNDGPEIQAQSTDVPDQIPMSGIGELQDNGIIPIIQNTTTTEHTKTTSLNPKPTCDTKNQIIPNKLSKPPSSISKSLTQTVQCDKSPSTVKKSLVSCTTPLNANARPDTTIVEEDKVCSYKKSKRKSSKSVQKTVQQRISNIVQEEENFLNEIDKIYEQYECDTDFSKMDEDFDLHLKKSPVKSVQCSIKSPEDYLDDKPNDEILTESILNVTQNSNLTLNQINRSISEPIILSDSPIEKTDLNSPFVQRDFTTPEKKLLPPPALTFTRDTLSQECLQERFKISNYYTNSAKLSVSEIYDLEHGFTPQPSTSKIAVSISSSKNRYDRTSSSVEVINIEDYDLDTNPYSAYQQPHITNYDSDRTATWTDCGAKIGEAWNKLDLIGSVNLCALNNALPTSKQSYENDYNAGKLDLEAIGIYDPFVYESDCEMNDYDNVSAMVLPTGTDDNGPDAEMNVSTATNDNNDDSKQEEKDSTEELDTDQMKESVVTTQANDNSGNIPPVIDNVSKMKQLEKSLVAFKDTLFDSKNLLIDTAVDDLEDDKPVVLSHTDDKAADDDSVIESTPPNTHTASHLIHTTISKTQVQEPPVVDSTLNPVGNDDSNTNISVENMARTQNAGKAQTEQLLTANVSEEVVVQKKTSKNNTGIEDDTIIESTPTKSEHLTQNFSISKRAFVLEDSSLPKTNIIMPKYCPPTYQDVENSLAEYNIPECRYQQPFYSDYADVTKKMDVGYNVLKIPSNTVMDLEEFQCSTGFIGLDAWRRQRYKELHPSQDVGKINFHITLAGNSEAILTPGIEPPTPQEVIEWVKAKEQAANTKKSPKKLQKPKILIPLSPSGNLDDSMSETMTLTPCSPDIPSPATSQSAVDTSETTPKSSQPLRQQHKPRAKEDLQRRVLFSQSKMKLSVPELEDVCAKPLTVSDASVHNNSHQITGVSLENTHDFKVDCENLQHAKAISEPQNLTIIVVELHIRTRGELCPDPQYDSVQAIFYSILNDVPSCVELPRKETGILVMDKESKPLLFGSEMECQIVYTKSEMELMLEFIKLVRKWDPDIFAGYEIEMHSWGYLIERCNVIGINLSAQISRINPAAVKTRTHDSAEQSRDLQLAGRIVLDIWRLIRHEIALQSYTFENIMYHILHERVPKYSYQRLSFWWDFKGNCYRHLTANYYIVRVQGVLKLLDQLDLIGRTAELAKLFGIQFFEVLSRGSQFRVESMMLRLAKPLNYIPVSPSVQQRAKMRAPEFLPLIFEPESRFYTDPVIVLDFQSLYPSIIIAYNYCFSTCIGRVENLGSNQPFEFGACQLKVPRDTLRKLEHKINFSPCGVAFVKPEVRKGILPRMLLEILETRLMVKNSMKENKDNKLLQRVLHSRQLGLKLIANVTYGYTAANFSGRMPCIEVGDSVVSKGRETLERAVKLIEQTPKWRARVVYGDTDSLFVMVAGRSKDEAFRIGAEIAELVTNDNPTPVKLKLEKILLPCILQTKKRYVGYMYESADQQEPEYLAKGIETVRRDGCPAVAKMLEKSLRILFETRDVSLVKRYVCRQFSKLLTGRASIQDLIFAREYRGASGYRPGACVPALELARRWRVSDKRREPRSGERVPYVIVNGPPGLPLIRLVRCPRELLADPSRLRPNAVYYITRVIVPPLNRCFTLIGADIQAWFNEMPRKQLQILPTDIHTEHSKKSTISQYFATMSCAACGHQTRDGLCAACCHLPQATLVVLYDKLNNWEQTYDEVIRICQACCSRSDYLDCNSLDCPVMYRLNQVRRDLKQVPFVQGLLKKKIGN